MRNPYLGLMLKSYGLAVESATVVGLRTLKLATGGAAAQAEATRMITEKAAALIELQAQALTGALGTDAVTAADRSLAHYRRKVRANRRRLQRDG